jgi:coproporphyrinogen III oxidase-like Fe-S oxidoreductase
MLGLRTAAGIVFSQFRERFGIDFREAFGEAAAALAREGLLAVSEERCAPTRRGMLFHDTLVSALTSDLETPPG